MASLYIKDAATAELVEQLARRRGTTKTEAVRRAVQADLDRDEAEPWVRDRMADFFRRFPPLESSGIKADRAFWDELSDGS